MIERDLKVYLDKVDYYTNQSVELFEQALRLYGLYTDNTRLESDFIFKRNTPQLAAAGIKGMRIQFRLRSAWPGSNFMRQRLGCPAACGVGALPPFHYKFK